jgi:hypothetical protein
VVVLVDTGAVPGLEDGPWLTAEELTGRLPALPPRLRGGLSPLPDLLRKYTVRGTNVQKDNWLRHTVKKLSRERKQSTGIEARQPSRKEEQQTKTAEVRRSYGVSSL